MPYKLRKAPKKDLYWVVNTDTGEKHSKEPIPRELANIIAIALGRRPPQACRTEARMFNPTREGFGKMRGGVLKQRRVIPPPDDIERLPYLRKEEMSPELYKRSFVYAQKKQKEAEDEGKVDYNWDKWIGLKAVEPYKSKLRTIMERAPPLRDKVEEGYVYRYKDELYKALRKHNNGLTTLPREIASPNMSDLWAEFPTIDDLNEISRSTGILVPRHHGY